MTGLRSVRCRVHGGRRRSCRRGGGGGPPPGAAPAVEAGRDPRPRRAAARRAPRGVRPHHRRGGGQADQDRPRRGRRVRCRRSSSPPPRRARWPARWFRSTRPTSGEGKLGFTLRVPIGVVGAISPFNFPLNLVAHKLAPAIAAGCPVVLKPASQTPFSAIALAELLIDECGLPRRLPQRRHRRRRRPSATRIVDHPDIALITFTGSPEVGWGIRATRAAQEGRARARQQRAGHHRARRRLEDRGRQDHGRRLQPRRSVVHLDAAHLRARVDRRRASSTCSSRRSRRSWSATRSTRPPTCRR